MATTLFATCAKASETPLVYRPECLGHAVTAPSRDRESLPHRIGDAETPREREEFARPHSAHRSVGFTEERVDRD